MTISKDRVKPSPLPDSWKLAEIFATGVVLGGYLAMMTVIFFWATYKTDFFPVCRSCLLLEIILYYWSFIYSFATYIITNDVKLQMFMNSYISTFSDDNQANDRFECGP